MPGNTTSVTVGLLVIGAVACAALIGAAWTGSIGVAIPVATAAIGGVAGWLAHGALTNKNDSPQA